LDRVKSNIQDSGASTFILCALGLFLEKYLEINGKLDVKFSFDEYIYKMNTIELVTERYYKETQANFTRGHVSVYDDFEIFSAFYLNFF